jgi:chromosome segregation ATPase
VKYFCRRVGRGRSLSPEERWVVTEVRLAQLLRAAEANLRANSELRQQQQEQQKQLEAERRHSEALRDSTADLRTSVMELREGQALWQSHVEELRSCLRELLKEQSELVQIVAQQQHILKDCQEVIRAILEQMRDDHRDFRSAIGILLEELHQTVRCLVLKSGGTLPKPVRHPEAPDPGSQPPDSASPGDGSLS